MSSFTLERHNVQRSYISKIFDRDSNLCPPAVLLPSDSITNIKRKEPSDQHQNIVLKSAHCVQHQCRGSSTRCLAQTCRPGSVTTIQRFVATKNEAQSRARMFQHRAKLPNSQNNSDLAVRHESCCQVSVDRGISPCCLSGHQQMHRWENKQSEECF